MLEFLKSGMKGQFHKSLLGRKIGFSLMHKEEAEILIWFPSLINCRSSTHGSLQTRKQCYARREILKILCLYSHDWNKNTQTRLSPVTKLKLLQARQIVVKNSSLLIFETPKFLPKLVFYLLHSFREKIRSGKVNIGFRRFTFILSSTWVLSNQK